MLIALVEAWNTHAVDSVAQFYAPDYEGSDVAYGTILYGLEGARRAATFYLGAFPDLHFVREEVVIQGNQAALAWTGRGTHLGKFMNIPPTGRTVEIRGVSVLTIEQNRIRRGLHIWDVAGLLRAIGLLPELP